VNNKVRLGTRGSPLALAQARTVAAALESARAVAVEIVTVTTTGDRVQDRPLAEIGGKALWTKELDRALVAGDVDFCVHSMKDVESDRPTHFVLAAMLERADVRDRLIGATSIDALSDGARVGTSSPRRTAQLQRLRPDLSIEILRGNVETRLRRVADGDIEATLLAAAGLDRLGIETGYPIGTETMLPAPGQAAIGIECRADDDDVRALLAAINHDETFACVSVERAFTRALGATCASPVAALATCDGDTIALDAEILSADGTVVMRQSIRCAAGDDRIPSQLAHAMLAQAPENIRNLFEVL
jgi:hydroxymethylbilane synthase